MGNMGDGGRENIGDIRLLNNRGEQHWGVCGRRGGSDIEIYGWEVPEVYQHNSLIRGTQGGPNLDPGECKLHMCLV